MRTKGRKQKFCGWRGRKTSAEFLTPTTASFKVCSQWTLEGRSNVPDSGIALDVIRVSRGRSLRFHSGTEGLDAQNGFVLSNVTAEVLKEHNSDVLLGSNCIQGQRETYNGLKNVIFWDVTPCGSCKN
jgi:hypothetical protein